MSLLHLWLGLLSSVVVLIICVTGCFYVFKTQIENLFNYKVTYVENQGTSTVALQELINNFHKNGLFITRIVLPNEKNKTIHVSYKTKENKAGAYYINPYTGKILGTKNYELDNFFDIILELHRNLLLGDFGNQIVGASVLIFSVLIISGLVLWWPKKIKDLKRSLIIKWKAKSFRVIYDLHRVLGVYSWVVLFLISITGLYITYPWVKNSIIVSLGGTPILSENSNDEVKKELSTRFSAFLGDIIEKQQERKRPPRSQVSLDSIILIANKTLNYEAITIINFPNEENSRFSIKKFNRENWLTAILPDVIEISRNGEVKSTDLFKDKPLNKQFISLSYPLHTGEIFGLSGAILYFMVSLIGCSLPITGFLVWWKKLKK